MPKCNDCGNTVQFLISWVQYEILLFVDGGRKVNLTSRYPTTQVINDNWGAVCCVCDSQNVEGDFYNENCA